MKNLFLNKWKYELFYFFEKFFKIGCLVDVISGKFLLVFLYFCFEKNEKCLNVIDVVLCDILFFIVYI